MNVFLIILGVICIGYDVTLISLNPGTFWDNVFSFTHIWSALGAYLVFVGIYRIKTRHSFWSIWKRWLKIAFVSLASLATVISVINLIFILTPEVVGIDEIGDTVTEMLVRMGIIGTCQTNGMNHLIRRALWKQLPQTGRHAAKDGR